MIGSKKFAKQKWIVTAQTAKTNILQQVIWFDDIIHKLSFKIIYFAISFCFLVRGNISWNTMRDATLLFILPILLQYYNPLLYYPLSYHSLDNKFLWSRIIYLEVPMNQSFGSIRTKTLPSTGPTGFSIAPDPLPARVTK